MENIKTIPQAPLTLTILGAIPLWIFCFLPKFLFTELAFPLFMYTAFLLTFLGGINWGISLLSKKKYYLWSIVPLIFAWFITFFYYLNERADNLSYFWMFLLAAIIVQWGVDYYIGSQNKKITWIELQRTIDTVIAAIPILIVIFRFAL